VFDFFSVYGKLMDDRIEGIRFCFKSFFLIETVQLKTRQGVYK
jgi:hypothetical protein